jgi:preprotein translocase subunit SecA
MAGRGVDIKVNDEVKALGGLSILGTERHENRRIDNQLRGRAGRQGDAGSSQFYLSLEDNLLRIFGSDKIKSIMERLGVEDGEFIESKMVTRAVEKAQKKVENLHFEGRKHIVEYDDVANEQRKIVYKFRNDLLTSEYDIATKIETIRVEYLINILMKCEILDGGVQEDFNLEKLALIIKEELNSTIPMEALENRDYDQILESCNEILKKDYNEKMSVIDDETRANIESEIYLKTLDKAWREHLYQMDSMKTGIRLRAYNQKDPLVEYKKESFNLFGELVETIKYETIKTLHVVQFRVQDAEAEAEAFAAKLEEDKRRIESQMNLNLHSDEVDLIPSENRAKRNDPCPCGSGKKYKLCCGKSGPKKGLFAS